MLELLSKAMLHLIIGWFINRLSHIQPWLRILKYVVDPSQPFKGAYLVAEGDLRQMEAEKDLFRSIKNAKDYLSLR